MGALLAAPLALGTAAAHAQLIEGDSEQSSSQNLASNQSGGDQNSANTANSSQDVGATLIIGDVGQAGEQDVSSKQSGGDTQNSANTANNAQSLGSLILIGDARQRNRQRASADQSHKKGIQNSANALSNAQSIATDVIIGDSDQDNNQSSLTSQTAESTASEGSTIVFGGIIEISVDDDLPWSISGSSRSIRSAEPRRSTRAPRSTTRRSSSAARSHDASVSVRGAAGLHPRCHAPGLLLTGAGVLSSAIATARGAAHPGLPRYWRRSPTLGDT